MALDVRRKSAHTVQTISKRLGLKHFTLVFVLVGYNFIGAALFQWAENENEQESENQLYQALNKSALNLTEAILNSINNADKLKSINSADESPVILQLIQNYHEFLSELDLKPLQHQNRKNWDFWGAMFYAGTICTTIGYGHYTPKTILGQTLTMAYAAFGIPLVLATLADMGKLLTKLLNKIYTGFRHSLHALVQRILSKTRDSLEITGTDSRALVEFQFPVLIVLFQLVAWICFCAAVFNIWETKWTIFECFYFFFISLSTIGFLEERLGIEAEDNNIDVEQMTENANEIRKQRRSTVSLGIFQA